MVDGVEPDRAKYSDNEELKKIQAAESENSYLKSLLFSSLFGGVFGAAVLVYMLLRGEAPGIIYYGLPLYCGGLSGLAGITGNYLQVRLQEKGIDSKLKRSLISFAVVLVISLVLTYFGFLRTDTANPLEELRNKIIWGPIIGGIFGGVIVVIEYYQWKVKQRMLVLELENKYLEELAARDIMLKEATKNLLVTRERNRMARELHDSVSQGIHGIVYSVGSLRQQLDREEITGDRIIQVVDHLEKTAEATLEELRSMIKELKPALLEKNSLTEAISAHCDLFANRQETVVEQELEEIEFLSPEQEFAVFRIIQEALANVQKHSGADRVLVSLKKTNVSAADNIAGNSQGAQPGQTAVLIIKDNGCGFERGEKVAGNGLNNMAVRSRQACGEFQLNSAPGRGAEIRVIFRGAI